MSAQKTTHWITKTSLTMKTREALLQNETLCLQMKNENAIIRGQNEFFVYKDL